MKNKLFPIAICAIASLSLVLHSCLKDTGFKKYSMYSPIYKTAGEVRANIKSNLNVPVINPGKMYIIGDYIFLNEKYKGVHIIDNSDPSNPVNKAFINIPGNEDIAVSGNTLYADCYTDLMVIDVTNPIQVSLKKHITNIFPDRRSVLGFPVDSSRFIVDWLVRDTTIKVDVPQESFLRGNILFVDDMGGINFSSASIANAGKAQGGSMARFTIQNNFLYTVTNSLLNVVDISQPQLPSLTNTINVGWGIETIYPFKDKLFLGSTTGMHIFSVANAAVPTRLGMFGHATVCDPVIADDKYAYVTLRNGTRCSGITNQLDIVDVQNPVASKLVKSYLLTNPRGLSKDGNWLFICDGAAGLKCFDATDANNLQLKKTIAIAETFDVICNNKTLVISAKDGLYQFSYSNINDIKFLSKIGIQK